MFECWVYKDEPHLRLVVKQGAMLPTELGHKDWKLLGPWEADADTALRSIIAAFTSSRRPNPMTMPA